MEKIISKLLKELKIPVSTSYCEELIMAHTDYPSILSIADTLDRLGIEHVVGQIEKEDLKEIRFPYLLQVNDRYGDLLLINKEVDLQNNTEQLKEWEGIIIKVEPTKKIIDEKHNKHYKKSRFHKAAITFLLMTLSVLLLWPITQTEIVVDNVLLMSSTISGIIIGYLLLAKELGIHYKFVDNLCNASVLKGSCDQILESTGFGFLRLSDVVISYFSFQFVFISLIVAFYGTIQAGFSTMVGMSMLTVPIIIFSLYFQGLIVKTWCRLCVVVVSILVFQVAIFSVLIYLNKYKFILDFTISIIAGLGFIAVLTTTMILKSLILENQKAKKNRIIQARIVNNPVVFLEQLYKDTKVTIPTFEQEIRMGNPDASIQILMVSNLLCKPCKEAHSQLSNMIRIYGDKVNVRFRYVNTRVDTSLNVSCLNFVLNYHQHHILGEENESELTMQFLHDWYELMNLKDFAKKHQQNLHFVNANLLELEHKHYQWCNKADIKGTPTFFINGYQLPQLYNLTLLTDIIPLLAEEFEKKNSKMLMLSS